MFKLLVTEDEAILREGVSDELRLTGLFDVAMAANGEEAFEMMQQGAYDALILDIRMPKMDGIQLLKKLHEAGDRSVKIIMSGYTDFQYAKTGIEYGVADYVVKPLSPDAIRSVGKKLYDMIAARKAKENEMAALKKQAEAVAPLRADVILSRLVSGELSGSEAAALLAKEGVPLRGDGLRVMLIDPVREDIRGRLAPAAVYMVRPETAAVILDRDFREEDLVAQLSGAYDRALIAVSDEKTGEERLGEAFMNAREALLYGQLLEKTGVIRYRDVVNSGSNIYLDEQEFSLLLSAAKKEELSAWMNRLFEDIPLNAPRQDYYSLAIYIAMLCQNNVRRLTAGKVNMVIDYEDVIRVRTLKGIKSWTEKIIDLACREVNDNSRQRGAFEIEKTKEYIDNHLSEDLSMTVLAQHAYLSPNYLGKIFYGAMGMSVSEYINRRRIEKACELIRAGNGKIYVIAETVGISDPNYFSSLFKKIMGMSPKEYKSIAGGREPGGPS